MAWYCRCRTFWCWYLFLIVVTVVLLKVVVTYRQSLPPYKLLSNSVNRHERKHSEGWSKMNTPYSSTDRGSRTELQSASSIISSHRTPPTARKVLFKGRPYTTPPTPIVVLPNFQAVAESPTKPPIPFYFPYPSLTKTPKEMFSEPWVGKLHKKLSSMPLQAVKQVSIVFSDSGYMESLLNWLIAAQVRLKPPLKNVLVICLDEVIFNLLTSKNIPAILVNKRMVLKPDAHLDKADTDYVWIIRMIVYRMINYFGYDVVSYDTDAVPFRNLQPVFEKYEDRDIIGSAGSFPFSLGRAWGFTMCMGVIRFRSSTNTELLWELMSSLKIKQDSVADQTRLNYAFRQCGIQWQSVVRPASHIKTKPISGQCSLPPYHRVKITVLPHSAICRKCVGKRKYYVVHPLSKKEGSVKISKATDVNSFFLARDWRNVREGLKGTDWLAALVNKSNHQIPSAHSSGTL